MHSFVIELGGSRRAALIGAILVLINPVTWFDSAIWGQVDSFGVIFLLLGLRDLWRGRPERASFFAVLAAIVKPQLGILIPLLVVVLLRRHLYDWLRPPSVAEADQDPAAELPPGPHGDPWLGRLGEGPIRLVTSAIVAFGTAIVLCIPFGLSPVGLFQQVAKAAGGYPYVTVNAYNPWALVSNDGNGLAANGLWNAVRDAAGSGPGETATLILGVPAVYVGTALLLAAIVVVCAVVAVNARRSSVVIDDGLPGGPVRVVTDERRLLVVALTVLAVAFFILPTRVHERYLFPAFAIAAILAATSIRWRVAYVVLALASFANLYAILLTPYFRNPGIKDWLGLGDAIRSPLGVTIAVAAHVAVFVWIVSELRPKEVRRLDVEALTEARWERLDDADEPADPASNEPEPDGAGLGLPVSAALATDGPDPPPTLGWAARSPASSGGWGDDVRADPGADAGLPLPFGLGRVRSLLPDRSRRLHGEGGGRFDRLDLWLLVVIVVLALVSRTFRLSEPYRMHFDEVYHARTATEFLQDWRYGQPHEIYEFTHPHLAKYAMAVGLILAGDDRVTAQRPLGTAVRDVLVEPRYDDPSLPGARAGDRFYVAGGDQVRAYDLVTREQVAAAAVPGAAALAIDGTGHRVLIGTDSGQLLALDTTELDALRSEPGYGSTVAGDIGPTELGTVGAPITRIGLTDDGAGLAVATSTGELVLDRPGHRRRAGSDPPRRHRRPGRRWRRERAHRRPLNGERPGRGRRGAGGDHRRRPGGLRAAADRANRCGPDPGRRPGRLPR